jgi:hypothetical protein
VLEIGSSTKFQLLPLFNIVGPFLGLTRNLGARHDVVHFMWLLAPLKERWCPHHVLRLFFTNLVWNSSMASWACSISDSFTQDASIRWYPCHLIKYSRSRPLSCLDLSIASTSNFGSLWTKSDGGLELCSQLGLEASWATDFKKETWNVGWTLRFFGSSNLSVLKSFFSNTLNGPTYGPKNLWFKFFGNRKFLMFNHTSSPSWNFPWVRAVVNQVSPCCPWLIPTPRVFFEGELTNLSLVLM